MEVMNMSIEKQRLYNEIDTLPEELTNQVINFIEYLKISYVDTDAPDNIMIKSKKDLKEKLQNLLQQGCRQGFQVRQAPRVQLTRYRLRHIP